MIENEEVDRNSVLSGLSSSLDSCFFQKESRIPSECKGILEINQ